ncbi:MAG: hypothetical protein [Bacteriophage sp.]|nr:MAG: hypothetical protein [Bacteriophage sp.]
MKKIKVSFFTCDKKNNVESREIEINDLVPADKIKMVASLVVSKEFPLVSGLTILNKSRQYTAVECGGLPGDVDCLASGY